MADLSSLIRLRKHTVDQKQKFLAGLYRQAEELENKKKSYEDKLAKEREVLEQQEMLEALAWYGRFAEGVKSQISLINKDIANMEQRIEIARADLRNAFGELKKVEITNRRRQEAEKKEEQRKEDIYLDDVGIDGHRRNSES